MWIPPIKEIHYFDMQRVLPFWHWIRLRRYAVHSRRYARHMFRKDVGRSKSFRHDLKWGLKYFLSPRSDAWYESILTPPRGMIAGELTPAYCMLDDASFQHMADRSPNTKLIFAMRDPLDRDWSQVVMHLKLHRRKSPPGEYLDEIKEVIGRDQVILRSSYLDVLAKLDRLPEDRVHIYFFDQVRDDPLETLRGICSFLEIEQDDQVLDASANQKIAGRDMANRTMPAEIERILAERWLPMARELSQRFGEIPARWEARMLRVLEGCGP